MVKPPVKSPARKPPVKKPPVKKPPVKKASASAAVKKELRAALAALKRALNAAG